MDGSKSNFYRTAQNDSRKDKDDSELRAVQRISGSRFSVTLRAERANSGGGYAAIYCVMPTGIAFQIQITNYQTAIFLRTHRPGSDRWGKIRNDWNLQRDRRQFYVESKKAVLCTIQMLPQRYLIWIKHKVAVWRNFNYQRIEKLLTT